MENHKGGKKKRKHAEDASESPTKRVLAVLANSTVHPPCTAGKIHRIFVRNFMCHEALEIILNPNVNFIIGQNGSGKSALLTALTVGLGTRANATKRGRSVKDLIKGGKSKATIEINIVNEGPFSYKPEQYGKMITVVRHIGNTSDYKLKSIDGKVISTRKEELEKIISQMNIQVDNPISVLNQDISREFLTSTNPSQMYKFFMKATQMDIIGENYQTAQILSEEARSHLHEVEMYLAESMQEVQDLEKSLKILESIESEKQKLETHQLELHWAKAIAEEKQLAKVQKLLDVQTQKLAEYESAENNRQSNEEKLTALIEERRIKLAEVEKEMADSAATFQTMKEAYMAKKEDVTKKMHEWEMSKKAVTRLQNDIASIDQEIKRLESAEDKSAEHARLKVEEEKQKKDLDEVDAMLRTKQNDVTHLHAEQRRLEHEHDLAKTELQRREEIVRKSKHELSMLRQQSNDPTSTFDANIPRLLKRIDEEHKRGRFHKKPIGPLGSYVKMKDSTWTAAVEYYLGAGLLGAFAVDNAQDANILRAIMQETYGGQRMPTIIASKFLPKVHDVSRGGTHPENHMNFLDVLEIAEPVVTNCLIDQKGLECIMLIPTSEEASRIMCDRRFVPANCKRALTKRGDEFFPDPRYKSYGGRVGRPKFLQVSTSDAIRAETQQLEEAEQAAAVALEAQRLTRDKLQRTLTEFREVSQKVLKLRSMRAAALARLASIAEELKDQKSEDTDVYMTEKKVLEKKIEEEREKEKRLSVEYEEMKTKFKESEDIKTYRERTQSLQDEVNKIRSDIQRLTNEKDILNSNFERANREAEHVQMAIQKLTAEYDTQKRVMEKFVAEAESHCPRMETDRSVEEIVKMANRLKGKISAIENKIGSKEELLLELTQKKEKYQGIESRLECVQGCNNRQLKRLEQRHKMYHEVKKKIGEKVQATFVNILKLRQYKGSVKISHSAKTLELDVSLQANGKKNISDVRSLSGGERSYSTVAFILALWDCTSLPFYFLDEFDVFMDKVNRRIILDILLDYTRSHPQSQFTLLTPLDTSIVQVDDYVTIHKLSPPERHAGGH